MNYRQFASWDGRQPYVTFRVFRQQHTFNVPLFGFSLFMWGACMTLLGCCLAGITLLPAYYYRTLLTHITSEPYYRILLQRITIYHITDIDLRPWLRSHRYVHIHIYDVRICIIYVCIQIMYTIRGIFNLLACCVVGTPYYGTKSGTAGAFEVGLPVLSMVTLCQCSFYYNWLAARRLVEKVCSFRSPNRFLFTHSRPLF